MNFQLPERLRRMSSTLKLVAAVAAGAAIAAGVTYASDLLSSSPPSPSPSGRGPCDEDGVTVGYDVGYAAAVAGYAIRAVRVIGIDGACEGASLYLALDDAQGDPLPGAEATVTVEGTSMRVPLVGDVPAAQAARVSLALAGYFEVNIPPPVVVVEQPPTSTTTPFPQLAPSLCPTVTGALVVTGLPVECGAVSASTATTAPVPVASWQANLFSDEVRVSLTIPDAAALPMMRLASGGSIVQLTVTRVSTGERVVAWAGVLAIDFPARTGPFNAAYSEDGISWSRIHALQGPTLPDGRRDGFFQHADRTITIFTRHATFFAIAPPPEQIALVHAKLLSSGAVRLTWTPSKAGLGVSTYEVERNGRVLATVRGTTTMVLLDRLGPRRSRLAVAAIDPLRERSPNSRPVTIRVPLLVGVRLARSAGAAVRAEVRLTARAKLRLFVLDPRGRKLALLPGSTVARRTASSAAAEFRVGRRTAGLYRISLRLRRAQLRPGVRYRIVVLAVGGSRADRAEIRFRG
jgi:hypothetical protein